MAGALNTAHNQALAHLQQFGPGDLPHALKQEKAIRAAKAQVSFLDQIEHPAAVRDFHLVRPPPGHSGRLGGRRTDGRARAERNH